MFYKGSSFIESKANIIIIMIVIANGTLWAWGWNGTGQLGDGTTTNSSTPVYILNINVPINITELSLNKPSTDLNVGQTEQLTATMTPDNATDKTVTWSIANQSEDNVVTVSSNGLVTAVKAGTAVVRATSNADPTKYAECNVIVSNAVADNLNAYTSVKVGADPSNINSVGIIVGIKDATDWNNFPVNLNINGYTAEIYFEPLNVNILKITDLTTLGNLTLAIDLETGKAIVNYTGTTDITTVDKLFFISLNLVGSAKEQTNLIIKFTNATTKNGENITISEPVSFAFQRGKIVNDLVNQDISITDAVAGLQYLAEIREAGLDEGQINPINMASILPPKQDATTIVPSVKDVIAMLQYLANLRDDSFLLIN